MRHLAYVQGLLISVSGSASFLRAELPDASNYFPPEYAAFYIPMTYISDSCFPVFPLPSSIRNTLMALQRFNFTALTRFIKFERPASADVCFFAILSITGNPTILFLTHFWQYYTGIKEKLKDLAEKLGDKKFLLFDDDTKEADLWIPEAGIAAFQVRAFILYILLILQRYLFFLFF
jgi:hypothetical protein